MRSVVLKEGGHLLELRLDIDPLQEIPKDVPVILTLRDRSQGGHYNGSEQKRLAELKKLSRLKPAYLDVESHVPLSFIEELDTKIILSYHNFEKTPEDLDALYAELKKKPAALYKIAVQANSSIDTLRMLQFIQKSDKKVIGISMGPLGTPGRILGPIVGNPMTYAYEETPTASGQLSVSSLENLYRFSSLNRKTAIYGLVGDPVDISISEHTHNPLLHAMGQDAVYVKFVVKKEEVHAFVELAKILPFKGLSVTMPLKETLFDTPINTLIFKDRKLSGHNTDGVGACDALEANMLLKDKSVVILGTGGAAKAIACEVEKRGGIVELIRRPFLQIPPVYDILINCTPSEMPIEAAAIYPGALVMDIKTTQAQTTLLKVAQGKGCPTLPGYHMFVEQAHHQFCLWLGHDPLIHPTLRSLTEAHLKTL